MASTARRGWACRATPRPGRGRLIFSRRAAPSSTRMTSRSLTARPGVKALQMIVDMIHKDQVMPPPSVSSWDYDQINGLPAGVGGDGDQLAVHALAGQRPAQSAVAGKVKIALAPMGTDYGVPGGGWKWLIAKASSTRRRRCSLSSLPRRPTSRPTWWRPTATRSTTP